MKLSIFLLTASLVVCFADEPQRIRITVERQDSVGKAWKAVNASTVFNQNDKLRFRMSANFSGYLYVMNQGTSGAYEQLFPRTDTGSDNYIVAGKDYFIPAWQGWFRVSGPAGQDVVYWVVSPKGLASEYKALPPPPPPGDVPAGLKPRCDDTVFKVRGECVDNSAGVRPIKAGDPMPENLAGAGGTPRELIFLQEKGGTTLSSPTPLQGPVIYELRLSHN
jgi:hypothetical protein